MAAFDWHLERLAACDSTQDEARARAEAGAPDGTVVIAARMDEGRGQHGHAWHAPAGGLYLSVVLRDLDDPAFLTLAAGIAVAETLEVAGAEPRLKWVNDVFVDGKKAAGVLAEASSTGDTIDHIVLGIGLNVNGHAADWGAPLATSAVTLEDILGVENCMEDVEVALLERLADWLGRLRAGRRDEILTAWRARDLLQGARVGFDPEGDFCAKLIGTGAGITDDGHLLLDVTEGEGAGERRAFSTGSAFLLD